MILILTLALTLFWLSVFGVGVLFVLRRRWWFGGILIVEAIVATAAQIAMTTIPVGIGQPLIRLPKAEWVWWVLGAGVLAVLFVIMLIGHWRATRATYPQVAPRRVSGVLILFPVLAALGLYGVSYFSTPLRERERNPDRRSIRLAPGFSYSVYAQGTGDFRMDNPTVMTFGPDGKLYIGDIAGDLWVATDRDGDFRVDVISKFAGGFDLLLGLAWRSDELFVSSAGKIEALRDTNGDGVADARRTVAEGLPALVLNPHSNNSLTFGPDGRLYFGVGRTTATGREPNPQAGAILSVSPDGGDVRVLAQGFGNPFDVAFNTRGDMFVGDNAGVSADGDSPPDKFHHVVAGGDYDDENDPFGPNKKAAVVQLGPHSVPTGLTFYSGKTYPAEYFDNAFMTLWNRGEVLRIQTSAVNNGYRARESIFGDGFLYPIDVVTGPDGNLYIADFGTSVIYRITYGGK